MYLLPWNPQEGSGTRKRERAHRISDASTNFNVISVREGVGGEVRWEKTINSPIDTDRVISPSDLGCTLEDMNLQLVVWK
jgi:hypothetical protein